jgi:hypothetical protein
MEFLEQLSESESGKLVGGFATVASEDDGTDALVNGNCGQARSLYNANCGCNKCSAGSNDGSGDGSGTGNGNGNGNGTGNGEGNN